MKERAIVLGIFRKNDTASHIDRRLEEMRRLCMTAGIEVLESFAQRSDSINPAYYAGTGKLEQIGTVADELKVGGNVTSAFIDGVLKVDDYITINGQSLLGTPVAGTFEFTDDKMYVTNVGTQRAIDRTSDVATSSVGCINTTDETTMWTGTIAANDLKVGNVLKVEAYGQISSDSAADVLTLKLYVGSTEIATIDSPGKASLGKRS